MLSLLVSFIFIAIVGTVLRDVLFYKSPCSKKKEDEDTNIGDLPSDV